jgi:hypothetical protein
MTLIVNTFDSDRYDVRKTGLLKIYVYITDTVRVRVFSARVAYVT